MLPTTASNSLRDVFSFPASAQDESGLRDFWQKHGRGWNTVQIWSGAGSRFIVHWKVYLNAPDGHGAIIRTSPHPTDALRRAYFAWSAERLKT